MDCRTRLALALLMAVLLLGITCAVSATPTAAQAAADDVAIRGVLQSYFDGLRERNVGKLQRAFRDDARMVTATRDGKPSEMTMPQFYEIVRVKRNEPPTWELTGRIESIEITGDAAIVKATVEFPKVVHTDYLSLLRLGGEWKIVHKTYVTKKK